MVDGQLTEQRVNFYQVQFLYFQVLNYRVDVDSLTVADVKTGVLFLKAERGGVLVFVLGFHEFLLVDAVDVEFADLCLG